MPRKLWTYDRLIELLKNTELELVWTEKEFNDNKQDNRTKSGKLRILIKHSCTCSKLRDITSLQKSIKNNNYLCGGGYRGICLKMYGQTFNEDLTKKYCSGCKNMLLLNNFGFYNGTFRSNCNTCCRQSEKKYREKNIKNRLKVALKGCVSATISRNDKGREHEFNIDLEYVLELWEKCNGICVRFKKKMSILDNDKWLVSIDRIDSNKGYIKGNVQLVCSLYNQMKMDRTEEDMDEAFAQLKIAVNN
tara:strand:- start:39 stop:782 length:744 start_codon:yes stop_codon:yes gene_type:complete